MVGGEVGLTVKKLRLRVGSQCTSSMSQSDEAKVLGLRTLMTNVFGSKRHDVLATEPPTLLPPFPQLTCHELITKSIS